jgi:hypothetical protein
MLRRRNAESNASAVTREADAVVLYLRRGIVYGHREAVTSFGATVGAPPFCAVNPQSPDELTGIVEYTFTGSRRSPATDLQRIFDPILALAGVKSYVSFARDAVALRIERTSVEDFIVIPSRNEGATRGFQWLPTSGRRVNRQGLGVAIQQAEALCE